MGIVRKLARAFRRRLGWLGVTPEPPARCTIGFPDGMAHGRDCRGREVVFYKEIEGGVIWPRCRIVTWDAVQAYCPADPPLVVSTQVPMPYLPGVPRHTIEVATLTCTRALLGRLVATPEAGTWATFLFESGGVRAAGVRLVGYASTDAVREAGPDTVVTVRDATFRVRVVIDHRVPGLSAAKE